MYSGLVQLLRADTCCSSRYEHRWSSEARRRDRAMSEKAHAGAPEMPLGAVVASSTYSCSRQSSVQEPTDA
jgi:hypothetical protein